MWTVNDGRDTVKGRHLRANPRATLAVDVEEFPYAFVVVHGAVTVDEYASDLLAWPTTIADRYVRRAARADYGERNTVDTEMLCRLWIDRWTGYRDIAL